MMMSDEMRHALCDLADLYAIGALNENERLAFETHLASNCPACERQILTGRTLLARLSGVAVPPKAIRERILDMVEAPRDGLDPKSVSWEQEIEPGIHVRPIRIDAQRGVRTILMWAEAGAHRHAHKHMGDEEILVLSGGLQVGEGAYDPGSICHNRAGSAHAEEPLSRDGYLVYIVHRMPARALPHEQNGADPFCQACSLYVVHHGALYRKIC
jgi:anti-sigma factor ChrR (cupin superfamily)